MSGQPAGLSGQRHEAAVADELSQLLSLWVDGQLDGAKVAALEARLSADPAARRAAIESLFLDAHLMEEFSASGLLGMIDALTSPDERPGGAGAAGRPPRAGRVWGISRVAALALITATLAAVSGVVATWHVVRAAVGVSGRGIVAEISRTRLAVPPAGTTGAAPAPLARGRTLQRGRIAIASGALELAFVEGWLMVLEGPADVELLGPDRVFLHRGVAVVRSPADAGEFELGTATARVVGGSGGEFAVKVDAALTTDVQVYLGDVLVSAGIKEGSGQYPDRLAAGEAIRISPQVDVAPLRLGFSEERFTRRVPDDAQGIGLSGDGSGLGNKTGVSRHAAIVVPRTTAPVTIDGDLAEWPPDPVFRRSRHDHPGDAEWIEGWMMFDDERLYVAANVGDPLPLRNSIDPELDAGLVWQGGGLQIFFSGDRGSGWPADANGPSYYANRKLPATLAERVRAENPRLMTLIMTHHAPTNTDRLFLGRTVVDYRPETVGPEAFAGRFRRSPDGRGYTLEYAIPWATLGLADDPPRSGDTLAVAWELHYSEETGKLWRDQIIEIRNPAEPTGIFLYERAATWGRAEFR